MLPVRQVKGILEKSEYFSGVLKNFTVMLYCPNPTCQTPNEAAHKFCQKCGSFLPKRYLWASGREASLYRSGERLADRYLCQEPQIFLDTKPGALPEPSREIPAEFSAYLRLSPYKLHVPQIYDVIGSPAAPQSQILLLDQAAIENIPSPSAATPLQVLPALEQVWHTATPLRQLNWLWQIAQLWQPLSSESAAGTLVSPELIRVEGAIVRLLELKITVNSGTDASLTNLGQFWSQWLLPPSKPEISSFLAYLCQLLTQGQIRNAEQLMISLDQGLTAIGRSLSQRIAIATQTDQGPSRQRNEDACYPPNGTHQVQEHAAHKPFETAPLVVVCDGIGGHQGGDEASGLAIASIQQQFQALQPERLSADELIVALEKAVGTANDLISERNDSEKRLERQRMGTTLVMGLVRAHELYITHVGDSRAYWITRQGCHQVTLDDDIASREVRLGYGSYRQALQQPIAGSLVQALGMGSSIGLHPTVQRFVLDDEGIFLLCSDGLSDFDRIDESWDTVILPVILGKVSLVDAIQQLVKIANTRNGHDNVTIGLVQYQVSATTPIEVPANLAEPPMLLTSQQAAAQEGRTRLVQSSGASNQAASGAIASSTSTQVLPQPESRHRILPLLLSIVILLALGAGLAALLFPGRVRQLLVRETPIPSTPTVSPEPTETLTPEPLAALATNDFIQISEALTLQTGEVPGSVSAEPITLPKDTVLQVLQKNAPAQQDTGSQRVSWVELQICSIPPTQGSDSANSSENQTPKPIAPVPTEPSSQLSPPEPTDSVDFSSLSLGDRGWIREVDVLRQSIAIATPTSLQRGACTTPTVPSNLPTIEK